MQFYFRFWFLPYYRNRYVILHQIAKFHPNWSILRGVMIVYGFSSWRPLLRNFTFVFGLEESLVSKGHYLSANRISSRQINPRLKDTYYWFGKTNIRHIAILLPVSISTTNFSWPFCPSCRRLRRPHCSEIITIIQLNRRWLTHVIQGAEIVIPVNAIEIALPATTSRTDQHAVARATSTVRQGVSSVTRRHGVLTNSPQGLVTTTIVRAARLARDSRLAVQARCVTIVTTA